MGKTDFTYYKKLELRELEIACQSKLAYKFQKFIALGGYNEPSAVKWIREQLDEGIYYWEGAKHKLIDYKPVTLEGSINKEYDIKYFSYQIEHIKLYRELVIKYGIAP